MSTSAEPSDCGVDDRLTVGLASGPSVHRLDLHADFAAARGDVREFFSVARRQNQLGSRIGQHFGG